MSTLEKSASSIGTRVLRSAIGIAVPIYVVGRACVRALLAQPETEDPPEVPPLAPSADGRLDVVDEASWESFPASDSPGY